MAPPVLWPSPVNVIRVATSRSTSNGSTRGIHPEATSLLMAARRRGGSWWYIEARRVARGTGTHKSVGIYVKFVALKTKRDGRWENRE